MLRTNPCERSILRGLSWRALHAFVALFMVALAATSAAQPLGVAERASFKALVPDDDEVCEPGWVGTFGGKPDADNTVLAMAVFDAGDGPELYVGGRFRNVAGVAGDWIAKWDGLEWRDVGGGMNGPVFALCVFDDGAGPALHVGGAFTLAGGVEVRNIARWDGEAWSGVGGGVDATVSALWAPDNEAALYVGGAFTTAGGVAANRVARWSGAHWSPLGAGVDAAVRALTTFDDGAGPRLIAGGSFLTAGGVDAQRLAQWDGEQWKPLGGGADNMVASLSVFDAGSGPILYAGGFFQHVGGEAIRYLAGWDGQAWGVVGEELSYPVFAMTVFDDGLGDGAALFVAGGFSDGAAGAGAARTWSKNIGKWNGAEWKPFSPGMSGFIFALAGYHDPNWGPMVCIGGRFSLLQLRSTHLAAWHNNRWNPIGGGFDFAPFAAAAFDDGAGRAIYFGGSFTAAGGLRANRVVKWDGDEWSTLGNGFSNGEVWALAEYDDGSGPTLYAGGTFSSAVPALPRGLARWNGEQWVGMPAEAGIPNPAHILAMTVFDDGNGPKLYAAGRFGQLQPFSFHFVASWDGVQWSRMNSPMALSMTVFDAGDGDELYVGSIEGVWKWDGESWMSVGEESMSLVTRLVTADFGDGSRLYAVARQYDQSGGYLGSVFRLDGQSWTVVGHPIEGDVYDITAFDDGDGPALYAGVRLFDAQDGLSPSRLLKLNGEQWVSVGSVTPHSIIFRLLTIEDQAIGIGRSLLAAGTFLQSPAGDSFIARYRGCPPPPCPADLNADGVVDVSDLRILLLNKGPCPDSGACVGDLDADGAVTGRDVALLVQAFGVCP